MTNNTQNIKCKVFNCKFNNNTLKLCELNEIEVNCDCDNNKCDCKEKTICNSYKKRK